MAATVTWSQLSEVPKAPPAVTVTFSGDKPKIVAISACSLTTNWGLL
ncbi:hypothetical protein EDE08_11736 [Bradyrhizobium sp. R2.2-H]|jgi:hypothetical protein|nr:MULTISPECIES: hypothetical protein [unclassified Bradyrhizobium]TCU64057.1 hypothetical protein EDE10_117110 [Bradyrhizobium sp. Y-H1]TCU65853.1 hypothetical protein EDE08_11736 [Bradyrhizobium sp. R2.2-H]